MKARLTASTLLHRAAVIAGLFVARSGVLALVLPRFVRY
jgi:hypothetical protein